MQGLIESKFSVKIDFLFFWLVSTRKCRFFYQGKVSRETFLIVTDLIPIVNLHNYRSRSTVSAD